MRGHIGPQRYDWSDCTEDSAQFRPLQVSTLRLSAHEPRPLMLAQRKQALLGPSAYGSLVSSRVSGMRTHIICKYSSSNRHVVMQSIVHNVLSTSESVASGTCSLELYGVMRYEESADKSPSLRGWGRDGALPRRGITEAPPKKSSIWSILEGSKLCRNKFVNISNIYLLVSLRLWQRISFNAPVSSPL